MGGRAGGGEELGRGLKREGILGEGPEGVRGSWGRGLRGGWNGVGGLGLKSLDWSVGNLSREEWSGIGVGRAQTENGKEGY